MIVFPAIDLLEGQCVRLSQGDYNQKKIYASDPLQMAQQFEVEGLKFLHLVDLEGARRKAVVHLDILKKIVENTSLEVQFGGGIKSKLDAERVLEAGAARIIIGSLAVSDPEEVLSWVKEFGPDKIVLGADLKNGQLAVNGWLESDGRSVNDFLKRYLTAGVEHVLCTDVSKDGMLQGPAFDLYRKLLNDFPNMKLLASGGVSQKNDLIRLEEIGCYGAVVGKALYEGRIELEELKEF